MKKIVYLLIFVSMTLSMVSCKKDDAQKDVDICITKLNLFNTKFAELYTDAVISKDTLENQTLSEYDALKKIASEYYEIMNKINTNIEKEIVLTSEGKETEGYEAAYKAALETKKAEIQQVTSLFEQNISKMEGKEIVEENNIQVTVEEVQKTQILSIRKKIEMQNIGMEMGSIYGELMSYIGKNNIKMSGIPIAIYHAWSDTINDIECGIPVDGKVTGTDLIKVSETYSGKIATAIHFGAYDKVYNTWMAIDKYIKDNNLEENGACWEEYITDPSTEKDSTKWQTKLCQPIK
jgi:effector-binding domain-containing protein